MPAIRQSNSTGMQNACGLKMLMSCIIISALCPSSACVAYCSLLFLVSVYSLLSRGVTVLAEQTADGVEGNFANVTRVLLKKIPTNEDSKMSYACQITFHMTQHSTNC